MPAMAAATGEVQFLERAAPEATAGRRVQEDELRRGEHEHRAQSERALQKLGARGEFVDDGERRQRRKRKRAAHTIDAQKESL